ncbi:hypothetical protein P5G61_08770 [Paenibacillus sp. F6_3S_P_1C]|uniref:Uncharacterized protein n=1 Tax=Paenibacillus vandeheii TaxID=3035917 RepID=A0ABT8J884_9BACL|nr:hypothetical protein [Paenibacillus vandeheii]MDN4601314.1 hypothetical protein [Paenibacillus vandeheii]
MAISKAMSILEFSVRERVQSRGTEMPVDDLKNDRANSEINLRRQDDSSGLLCVFFAFKPR